MQAVTLSDVLRMLRQIVDTSTAEGSRQGYFALLYLRMTEAVAESINAGRFDDAARMEKLDVVFANRYLDAWYAYRQGRPLNRCWKQAFDAAKDDRLIVLQHLVLGVNAHINLDLAAAAAAMAPGDRIWQLEKDFHRINDIIAGLTDEMQQRLERITWPMRMLRRLAGGRDNAVIAFSIARARDVSWANALALAHATDPHAQRAQINRIDEVVAGIGGKIMEPGTWGRQLAKAIRYFEPRSVQETLLQLSRT